MNRIDTKLLEVWSPFNSEKKCCCGLLMVYIFVRHSIPDGNSVTIIGKIAWEQTGSMALIDTGQCKETLLTCVCDNLATYSTSEPQEAPTNPKLAIIYIHGVIQG